MRKCIVFAPTNLCVNVIEDPDNTYTPPDGYYVPDDNTGNIYDYWTGVNWFRQTDILISAYITNGTTNAPDLNDETDRIPTTFWVRREIQDYIQNVFLPNFVLDGGEFGDAAIALTYDAGYFNDTGSNLDTSLEATLFDDTGGNLTSDIHASTF